MLTVRFRFPGGLYHATPYGRHVNEGEVEWPPSPWRVARALVATGFTKLGWTEVPAGLRRLLHALGGEAPVWWVPPGTLGHSRHYLPQYDDATSKVLDAWVRLPRDAWSYATWSTAPTEDERGALDALVAHLGYLGRSESWVEAERWEEPVPSGLVRVDTVGASDDDQPVEVLRLEDPDRFRSWRAARVEEAAAQLLAEQRRKDEAKGKAPRAALSKADRAKTEAAWPAEPLDAALLRTSELRGADFAQPPGTRRSTWRRPPEALAGARPAPPARPARRETPTFALLSVTPDTREAAALMRLADAVWVGEKVHDALVSVTDAAAAELVGHQDDHRHLSIVPLALGGERAHDDDLLDKLPFRRIDHVLLWSPAGLSRPLVDRLTARHVRVFAKNLPDQRLDCLGLTHRVAELPGIDHLGTAREWVSLTPFVPSRHLKKRGHNGLEGQVAAELAWRGLPAPLRVEVDPRAAWRHFRCSRQAAGKGPPQRVWFGLRLTFDEPLSGPLLLGYGSHFGLGQFVPA